MIKVSETTPLVYHYTSAAGLTGIIDSQKVHATSIAYLNDEEEHRGYFVHRLPALLNKCIYEAYLDGFQEHPSDKRPPLDELQAESANVAKKMSADMWDVTERLHEPYVASFSAPPDLDSEDGLLSQWRGYGRDGGYAIVFETAGIERLLDLEYAAFHYQYLMFADVEYYDNPTSGGAKHPETIEDERKIQNAIKRFVLREDRSALDDVANPITSLSVRHKHRGFREEAEIRIVALRSVPEVWKQEKANGEPRSQRELRFKSRDGLLVPYIELFGKDKLGGDANLPIRQVIVGPHPEKEKRREAIERLLKQRKIDAYVTTSSIPFVGSW
jgi:hypothetical protein